MRANIYKNNSGFLWPEWIVAIATVFIIAFLIFSFFSLKQMQLRDEQRIDGLMIVVNALESYYDVYGYYPSSLSQWGADDNKFNLDIVTGARDYNNLFSLLSLFVDSLASDPLNSGNNPGVDDFYIYRYVSSDDGQEFMILFETETKNDSSPSVLRSR